MMLEVFDVGGRKVATLLDGRLSAGFHRVLWDAGERGAGVYFYKIEKRSAELSCGSLTLPLENELFWMP